MNIRIISFTDRGQALSRHIAALLPADNVTQYAHAAGFLPYDSVRDFARDAMAQADAVLFIGAAGIAVRAIAPYVRGKDTDPAVLVLDENGRFVIPLLSGHLGGANRLAARLADVLGAEPVITTATDGRGIFAADSWAREHGCAVCDTREIKYLSAALLRGETVGLVSDFPIVGALPDGVAEGTEAENGILLSACEKKAPFAHTLRLAPRILHIGAGCRRNTPPEQLRAWAEEQMKRLDVLPQAVASVASIAIKRDEPAILQLAEAWCVPTRFYTAEELERVPGDFPPSDFVRKTTGTDNVCQRAAAKASGNGRCLLPKTAHDGMTISIYIENWRAEF